MYPIERKQAILQVVNKKKSVSVSELAKTLFICDATIRRDLTELEKLGQLKRTHGGAVSLTESSVETPIDIRKNEQLHAKAYIAGTAAELVSGGMTLFMDGSTTCLKLLPLLYRRLPLTVITNGIMTAAEAAKYGDFNLISLGGKLNFTTGVCDGQLTIDALSHFYADLFFFSAKGISLEHGVTESFYESAAVKLQMIAHSKKKILLCDGTKFNQICPAKICDIASIDVIVTDKKPPQEWKTFAEEHNILILS